MNVSLEGKSIAVTGAESGIGRAIALECAASGATPVLIGLVKDGLDETAGLIRSEHGISARVEVADITDEPRMDRLFADLAAGPGLDGLAANAGRSQRMVPSVELGLDEWRSVIDVNLTGTFITLRTAARAMRAKGGSIIVTGSSTAERPLPDLASKAGVHALVRALAREFAPEIRINLLVPGTTDTPFTRAIPGHLDRIASNMPMKSVVQPEELARMAAFALSDQVPHMTGSSLLVDAGRSAL
ncbi:MAG: SDR family oxidoreductase [Sphingomonadales bacterium]|nr:SDR family oxidoreductase [Sphingomonadales bacterium]